MPVGLVGASTRYSIVSRVVTAAASRDLTDLDTVKAELDLSGVDANRDKRLTRYIKEASRAAENYCNRIFAAETVEDTFFPRRDPPLVIALEGLDPLQLIRWPIISVTSVLENGAALTLDTDYRIDADPGQLLRLDLNLYPRRWDALPIVVTYSAGYGSIPEDVSGAVIRMVVARQNAFRRDPNIDSESVDGIGKFNYRRPTPGEGNMTPDVTDLLDNYHVPVVA
jgi:hypothetical protein